MIITRETDYAIRALRSLRNGRKKTLKEICDEEVLPKQFGYKLMKKLANEGFVKIKRGKQGGYVLGDVTNKSLYDIKVVIGNTTKVSVCMSDTHLCEYRAANEGRRCHIHDTLSDLQALIDDRLKSVNIYTLITTED